MQNKIDYHTTMTERSTYFIEKTSQVIRKLISAPGNAKERLLENEVEICLSISASIPEDLKPKREKIFSALRKKNEIIVGDTVVMSSYKNTVRSMKNKTAGKIILDIYDLYSEVWFRSQNS